MATQIQKRVGTILEWEFNPILMEGEDGIELETGKFKTGNGINRWADLPYFGYAGSIEIPWAYILNKPSGFTASAHKSTHAIGGSDLLSPQDIGAEPDFTKNSAFNKVFGAIAGTVTEGNDFRLLNSRRCDNTFDSVITARTNLDVFSKLEANTNFQSTIIAGTTSQYYRGDKTFQTLDKVAVGLGNLTNEAQIPLTQKAVANGVATLDVNGKLLTSQLPALAISETFVTNSQSAMLLVTAQRGDFCIRTDIQKNFILNTDDPTIFANWIELLTPSDNVLSVNSKTGNVVLTTADISDSLDRRYLSDAQRTLAIQLASTSLTGLLSSTDWNTFNNKVATTRSILTSGGIIGGGDLSADRTLSLTYGTVVNTVCQGNDLRLSDARNPLTHIHTIIDVTNLSNELSNRILTSTRAVANGVATLDASALIPDSQIASNIVRKVDNRITIGAVNFNDTLPSLLQDGDIYFDSASQTNKIHNNGKEMFIVRNLWVQTAINSISQATTTATSLLTGSGGAGIGDLTFPVGFWVAGRVLRIVISGHIVRTNSSTITPSITLGGVTINVPGTTTSLATSSNFTLEALITTYSPTEFWVEGRFSTLGTTNAVTQTRISRINATGTPISAVVANPNSIDVLVAKGTANRLTISTTSAIIMVLS